MRSINTFIRTNYTFEGKKSYENVIVLLYRHWFILIGKFLFFLILGLLPFWIYILPANLSSESIDNLFQLFISVYYLIWWLGLFYNITMYLLDTWIVTDHRVIDSEQHGFFNRTVSELNLAKIQDISVKVEGFIPTVLNFGNLEIQTAGTEPKFTFKQIPNPQQVKDQIIRAHDEYMREHKRGIEVHERTGV